MSGRILIIDSQSNRRIHLRARLDTASCDVIMAESQSEGLGIIRTSAPDVVLIADDLPGLKLQQFCRSLRLDPKTQFVTVMVIVALENLSARISALSAGATDVIAHANDPDDLQARIRSILRQKQVSETAGLVAGKIRNIGFAEKPLGFAKPRIVTVVADTLPVALAEAPGDWGFTFRQATPKDLRRVAGVDTDVFVVFESANLADGRNILATLRSTAETCRAGILYISEAGNDMSGPSPLDFGAHDLVTSNVSAEEILLRIRRLAHSKHRADQERDELSNLGYKAYSDVLTGLNNRAFAEEFLSKQDQDGANGTAALALLMADVDHFKTINDLHGHAAGDEILKTVASVFRSGLRSTDVVSRFGGEEFLIALPGTDGPHALIVAERLRKALSGRSTTLENGMVVSVTVSIGIAASTRRFAYRSHDLRRAADNALYRAKHQGRNRCVLACPDDYLVRAAKTR